MPNGLSFLGSRRCLELWRHELNKRGSKHQADFLRLPLLLPRGAEFRMAATCSDVQRVYENMAMLQVHLSHMTGAAIFSVPLLQFLPKHILVVDPLGVSIEYLFKPSRTGVVYCGDPNFEAEFASLSSK